MDPVAMQRIGDRLRQGSWFGGLPAALQQRMLARASVRRYAKGQVVSLEGRVPPGLFCVLEGQVKVVRFTEAGDEALVYVGGPGFWFAEYAWLMNAAAVVSFIARSPAKILIVGRADLDRIVEEEPRYFRDLARLAVLRSAIYLRAFVHVASLTPDRRLLGQLALLTQLRMQEQAPDQPVDLPISQVDLAAIVGVTRQTISPLIKALVDAGRIELRFRHIRVPDPRALCDLDSPRAGDDRRSA
jgi:CRP-like cAMP-binding protein